jgi:hypothetical protein
VRYPLALLLAASAPLTAQSPATALVTGTVVRQEGAPVRGAVARLDGVARATLTDSAGRFTLVAPRGIARLHLRLVGFGAVDTTLLLTGDRVALFFRMTPVATVLDTARVTAVAGKPDRYSSTSRFDGFYARKASAVGGAFLTLEEIEQSPGSGAVDLLRGVPGVGIERTALGLPIPRFPRCAGVAGAGGRPEARDGSGPSATVQVFVDGVRAAEPYVTLSALTTADIEAMEVYRSVSELPAEARGDGCAAIMIWTRYTAGATQSAAPRAP